MKHTFSIFIVNPANGEFVSLADWRNTENPTSAEFVAIVREDKSGIIIAKDLVKVDGEINFEWKKAVELAKAFKPATDVASLAVEGFRLPDRREALDIYDARFQGLDDALALIGGTPVHTGDARWIWTEDEDPDPEYDSDYAFFFHGGSGGVNGSRKCSTATVRPVSAFLPF